MKKLLKFLGAMVFATLLTANVFAYDFVVDGIYYDKIGSGNTVSVTYGNTYNSYSGSVNIPSTVSYDGYTYFVERISSAFENCTGLTSVTIGNSVTTIGVYAFKECTSLSVLQIGTSVNTIEDKAFYKCSSLDSIYCKSQEPPVLGSAVFGSTNRSDIILIVPCGKQAVYQVASGWSLFTNIQEDCGDSYLKDISEENSIFIYPNPANENITLIADEDIFIYNNLGQIVKQVNNPKGEATIKVSDLQKGIYYVKIGNRKQKLVKEQ